MVDVIPAADSFVRYTVASSTTGPFTFSFQYLEDADLEVLVNGIAPTSNYTVTQGAPLEYAGINGGSITFDTALAASDILTIARVTVKKRVSNLVGASLTANNLNVDYNKIVYILQEFYRDIGRALLADYGASSAGLDADSVAALLPYAADIEELATLDAEIAALGAITGDITAVSAEIASVVTCATNIAAIVAAAGGTSIDWKPSVRVASDQAGTLASDFAAGEAVDGITLAENDRILLKNQTASAENGIYTVNLSGAPTRATDFDGSASVTPGAVAYVEEGTVNEKKLFVLETSGAITIGTTGLTFRDLTGSGSASGNSAWKPQVRLATTANIDLANLNTGDTIDGVTVALGDRILVKSQTASTQNGIYIVPASGFPNRADDFNDNTDVEDGAFVYVLEGAAEAGTLWALTTTGTVTIGTSNLVFAEVSGGGSGASGPPTYTSIAGLVAGSAGTSASSRAVVNDALRGGEFRWLTGDQSALVTLDPQQGLYVAPSTDVTGASGVWVRVFTGPAMVTWFGALGDGSNNDTTLCQAALATGFDIHFPGVSSGNYYSCSSVLNVTTPGQQITGDGKRSDIRQSGADASANLFVITATDVHFEKLSVRPGTVTNSTYQGFAFYFSNADRARVTACYGTQHRRGIVMLNNSSDSEIDSNTFEVSVVTSASNPDNSDAGADIWLVNGTSDCLVHSNILHLGCGSGISVQTITRTNCNNNLIYNNIVTEAPSYGIYLYCGDIADECEGNVVSDNIVDTIYGFVESIVASSNTFGAGIYFQATGHNICTGNNLHNCNVNTDAEVLAPAAIGAINNRSTQIVGNKIWNTNWYGIMVADPNENNSFADALFKVSQNSIYSPNRDGIYAKDVPKVQIDGNEIIDGTIRGIFVRNVNTTTTDHVTITNNYAEGCGNSGLELNDADLVVCANNMWLDCASRGAVFTNCDVINHTGDLSDRCSSIGIYYLNCTHITGNGVTVYDAGQGLSNRSGFQVDGCTDLKLTNCHARIRSGTAMQYGINFNGSGNSQIQLTSCEFEGTVTDVTGTAPSNIIWTDCIADIQAGFGRKDRSISGTTLNANRWDRHLYVGAGTIRTIATTNTRSGQLLFLTFSGTVTFDHGFDNVFCNNDTDQVCGPSGSGNILSAWARRTGNNWIIQT